MMLALSPLARRLLALGLLLLALLLAVQLVIAPLGDWISGERARLDHAQARAARLEAAQAWGDVPGVPAALQRAFLPHAGAAATSALEARLTALAAQHAVEISIGASPEPTAAAPARASLAVSGTHDDVLAFLASLESGAPVLRIETLDLAPASGSIGSLSASIDVVAARRQRP